MHEEIAKTLQDKLKMMLRRKTLFLKELLSNNDRIQKENDSKAIETFTRIPFFSSICKKEEK